jgi:Leucine-rich repeat (LRR) protein
MNTEDKMRRKKMLRCRAVLVGFFILVIFVNLFGAIPASERAALIAIYNSTHGDNWVNNSGWKTPPLDGDGFAGPGTEDTWYGVAVRDENVYGLEMDQNDLTGSIPAEISQLSKLGWIWFRYNHLSGNIPPQITNLLYLENLDLGDNEFTGEIPPFIGNIKSLSALNLCGNQFIGSIPLTFGNLVNMVEMHLEGNKLTGNIPSELGNLKNLQHLGLVINQFSGEIPLSFGNLVNLKSLNVGLNQLTGTPLILFNLTNLEELALGCNQFTGNIPESIGNLKKLKYLNLSSNQFEGSIPKAIGNLTNLLEITLQDNRLTGEIPTEIKNLSNLVILRLESNKLNGNIPSEIGKLSQLTDLFLEYNQLSGLIPTGLGNLTKLTHLTLNHNQLAGQIPNSLINLAKLAKPNVDIGYNCLYTDDPTLTPWLNNVDPDWAEHQDQCAQGTIKLNREKLNFGVIGGTASPPQSITIENSGSGSLNWVISSDLSWLLFDKESGTNTGTVSVSVDSTNLPAGTYEGTISVTDPFATNSPQSINVTLKVYNTGENTVPFGNFATPTNASTVSGSIAVTGWVLDDIGIESVKLYRGEVGNLTYIGDAIFVEGARPDVEQAYPGYPMNYKAGWGYMMLTNFLPGGGNGEFKIHAVVKDAEGNQITLGTKTIRCDNAHAVKPFGAIDTPTQGGTASGKNFVNWGWVLTPLPNKIPEDGSTIKIWVDGKNIGHPTYNIYREDIATLFPGYKNSNGAIGYFYLDTSGYENGIHTIQWTATDNAGNTDGIGSRYFSILNSGESSSHSHSTVKYRYQNDNNSILNFSIEEIPMSNSEPLRIEKGTDEEAYCIEPDENGIYFIEIEELERLEVTISDSSAVAAGFILVGAQLKPLPVGTTLCQDTGKFYWTPGPGFVGSYHFVFIERDRDNYLSRKEVIVDITPKSTVIHH